MAVCPSTGCTVGHVAGGAGAIVVGKGCTHNPVFVNLGIITNLVCFVLLAEVGCLCVHFLLAGVVFSPQSALAFQYAQVAHTLHKVVVFRTPHHGCCCHGGFDCSHGYRLATSNDFNLIQRSIIVNNRRFFAATDFYIIDGYEALSILIGLKAYSAACNLSAGGQAFGN